MHVCVWLNVMKNLSKEERRRKGGIMGEEQGKKRGGNRVTART